MHSRFFCGLVQLNGFHKMLTGSIRLKWKLMLWHLFSCSGIVNNPLPSTSQLRPNDWVFMVRRGTHGDKLGISKTPYTLHDDSYGCLRCQKELYSALFDPLNWRMDDYLNEVKKVIAYIAVCQFNVCTTKSHVILIIEKHRLTSTLAVECHSPGNNFEEKICHKETIEDTCNN